MERQRLARCLPPAQQFISVSATVFPEFCYRVAGLALPSRATRHKPSRHQTQGLEMAGQTLPPRRLATTPPRTRNHHSNA